MFCVRRTFHAAKLGLLPASEASHAALWQEASVAAADFWSRVAVNPLVSDRFREIARKNQLKVQQLAAVAKLLRTVSSEPREE
jgi:hypothetical protein